MFESAIATLVAAAAVVVVVVTCVLHPLVIFDKSSAN